MKELPIPVQAAFDPHGPGSQAGAGDGLAHTPFPRDLPVFTMPQVPANADAASIGAARRLLDRFVEQMRDGAPRLELVALPADVVRVLNESLGEGEVCIRIVAHNGDDTEIRIQETVFAGIWREQHLKGDGSLAHDWLQACPVPPVTIERALGAASSHVPAVEMPHGAMNAPALMTEIREHLLRFRPDRSPHVINLTLLPLTAEDREVLDRVAPAGPVAILSRGFGNCRITSTRLCNLWRVQYFNSMQTLILNTLEVIDVPEVALAAAEDLADSRERLRELVDWMGEDGSA